MISEVGRDALEEPPNFDALKMALTIVDEEVIAEVVSKMTGIPLTRMTTEDSMRLMQMEEELQKEKEYLDAVINNIED